MGSSAKRAPPIAEAATAAPACPLVRASDGPAPLAIPAAPVAKGARGKRTRALPIRSSPVSTERSLRSSLETLHTQVAPGRKAPARAKPAPFVRKPVLQELEARLLLSADLNPAAQDTLLATPSMQGAEFRALVEPVVPTVVTSAQVAPIQRTHELVFVDTATPEYQALVEAMRESALAQGRNLEFVLIDAERDGIRKITDTLAQKSDLDAIHIISHASDGAVQLGSTKLDFDTLLKRAASVKKWGEALADNGDILLYGCDLAATQQGRSLLDAIARLTGADVAASEDPTGAADKGGDWNLEFTTGRIEAQIALSQTDQARWEWLLALPVVDLNGPATFTASDTFDASTYTGGTGWTGGWVEFDASRTRFVGTPSSNSDNSPNTGNVVYGNLAGGVNEIAFVGHNNQDDDWIQRSVDLLSYTSATLSFSYRLQGIESPDAISVQVSKDGGATFTTLATYTADGSASPSFDISSYISDKSVIRFAVTGGFDGGGPNDDRFFLDNVQITASGNNYDTSFTEGGPAVAIAGPNTTVIDPDGSQITSAIITLTNPQAGDVLSWAALPPGITASLSGNTVTLIGAASGATYATALRQVAFSNTGDAPNTTLRTLTVRVTDSTGEQSTTVTSFVRVVLVDDPLVAAPDAFATYTGTPVSGNVLANNGSGPDTDPDGALSVDTTLVTSPVNGAVTMNADGTFTYTPNPAFNGTDTFQYRLVSEAQVPGAYYEYWGTTPSANKLLSGFPTGVPTATGYATSFDVDQIAIAAGNTALTDFTIRFTTSIEILNSGTYTFWTGSDDGSVLRVTSPAGATTLVVDNDSNHPWSERSGTISLTPGRYTIQVEFFEVGTGQEDLNVFYSGADTFNGTVNIKTDLGAVAGRLAPTYATGSVTITVAANDAPVASGSATLAAVLEDAASPAGAQVSALFAGNYSDAADGMLASPLSAVAIIANAATAAEGTWQYASVAAGPWSNVPTAGLADTTALVLPASYYLRFVPAANYNGTPGSLTVRLADGSAGAIAFSGSANISAAIGGTGNWSATSIALGTSITPVNDAPTVSAPASFTVTEDVAGNLVYTGTPFADVDSASLTVTLSIPDGTVSASSGGGVTVGGTATARTFNGTVAALNTYFTTAGNITYTTALNNNTARTLTTQVSDGSLSASATSTVDITPVNDAPLANDDAAGVQEDVTLAASGEVFANDTDVDAGDTKTVTLVNGAAGNVGVAVAGTYGTVTLNADGSYTYTLNNAAAVVQQLRAGQTVTDTFSYQMSDGAGAPASANLVVTITGSNDAPVAVNDSYSVTEDGSLTVGWWDLDWTQRQQITFSGNTGAGTQTLTNFPVLVTLNSGNIDYTQTQNDGGDLRFFDPDGTPLAYEVERWDESGTSYVWVKVPQIDNSGTDFIRMYYGNAVAPNGQNPSAVWSGNGYSAVYHLDDGGPAIDDATANGFGGTALNGAASTTGQIYLAQNFDGTNDHIDLGANRAFLNGASAAAFSAWINPDTVAGGQVILTTSINNSGTPTDTSRFAFERQGDEIQVIIRSDDATATTIQTTATNLVAGQWYHVTGVVDLVADTVTIYVNGVAQLTSGAINMPGIAFPATGSASSQIGSNDAGGTSYFDGRIDEARIATAVRSAGWVLADYRAMTNAFVTMGGAQLAPATAGVLDNDTDADGNSLTATLVSGPASGALTLNADGTFTYTPNADFYGTDTFTYRANDGTVNSNVATVTITVTPVADIVNDATSTNEDTPVVLNVLTNDSFENAGRTVTSVTNGANGTVTIVNGALGTVQYTPNANFNGSDSFTYTVTSGGATETASVTVTVTPVNDAPTLGNGTLASIAEDNFTFAGQTVATIFTGQFADIDAGSSFGGIAVVGNTANAGTQGAWQYSTNGGTNWFAIGAVADNATALVVSTTTLIRFSPVANYNGSPPALTVRGLDNTYAGGFSTTAGVETRVNVNTTTTGGTTAIAATTATISTSVTPVNDAPVATDDAYAVGEDAPLNIAAAGVLTNDTDVDVEALSVVEVNGSALNVGATITLASGAQLTLNANGSFTYNPNGAFEGLDSGESTTDAFTYRAGDGTASSNAATVTLTINGANDAPVATDDAYAVGEDAPLNIAAAGVLTNDTDVDVEALSVVEVNGSALNVGATITLASGAQLTLNANGSFTYNPNGAFEGLDSGESTTDAFTYRAGDGTASSNAATVTLTINGANDAPVATDDAYAVGEDAPLNIAAAGVLTNDTDVDVEALSVVEVNGSALNVGATITLASGAQLTLNANGSFTYNPNGAFEGLDSGESTTDAFTYRAGDGTASSNAATVTLTINGANDAPVATDDAYAVGEDAPLNIAAAGVLTNDTDVDVEALSVVEVNGSALNVGATITLASGAQLTLNANGSFTYNPNGAFEGLDSGESTTDAFTYRAGDGTASSNAATVTLTINGANDAPVATDDAYAVGEDAPLNIAAAGVLTNDTDVDVEALSVVEVNGSALNVGATITLASGAQLTLNANGSFTYNPNGAFEGLDSGESTTDAFTYRAGDGTASSNAATVTLTINGANDAPVATDDAYAVGEDAPLNIAAAGVLTNDTDVDVEALSVVEVNGSALNVGATITLASGAQLTLNANGSFTYNPNGAFEGLDSGESTTDAFTYRAGDGTASSNAATVTLTINGANDAPVATDDAYAVGEDAPLNIAAAGVLTNDTDVDVEALSVVEVNGSALNVGATITLASGAQLTLNANGSFTYNPNGAFEGLDSGESTTDAFTYRAGDGTASSNAATVTLTINGANDAPVATDDAYAVGEDAPLNIAAAGVLTNDTDVDVEALSVVEVNGSALNVGATITLASGAQLTLNANGSFTYNPNGAFEGLDSGESTTDAFTYRAGDGTASSNAATVTLTINGANDAPVATDDAYAVGEDAPLNIAAAGVLTNDTDVDVEALSVVEVNGSALNVGATITLASGAQLTLNANGSFTYNPNGAFEGLDSGESTTDAFTYRAGDGTASSNAATVTLTINGANDAPVATDDAYAVGEDAPLNIAAAGVLTNDTDVDVEALSVVEVNGSALNVGATITLASGAQLTLNANGSFTYNPNGAFEGLDSGESTTDAFTYRAGDGTASSNAATVTLTINGANDAPVATDDAYAVGEDAPLNIAAAGVLTNDTDVDVEALSVVEVNGSALNVGATITLASGAQLTLNANGSFTYNPNGAFEGLDSGESTTDAFTYRAGDGTASSNAATVTLTINGANDAPVATDDAYAVGEDAPLNIAAAGVLTNDTDVDVEALSVVEVNGSALNVGATITLASGAQLTLNANGSFTYNPNGAFEGLDSGESTTDAFTYRAGDGTASSNAATVTLTINGANDAPVATDDAYAVGEDAPLNIAAAGVLTNDTDVDVEALSVVEVNGSALNVGATITLASGAQLTLNANGSFTYNPNGAFEGLDSGESTTDAFTYRAGDGTASSNAATVTLTINGANDAPVATDDAYAVGEDAPLNIDVLANDTDVDVEPLTVTAINGTSISVGASVAVVNGSVTLLANGTLDFAPAFNYNGPVSFSYSVSDGDLTDSGTVSITVTPVNDDPTAAADAASVNEDSGANAIAVLANDSILPDAGETLTITAVTNGTNGTVAITGGGTGLTYTPNANFFGADAFTYTISDGNGGTATATVNVTVTNVNDPPALGNNSFTITAGGTLGIDGGNLSATDVDDASGGLVFQIGTISNGFFARTSSPGTPIGSFTQAQVQSGQVQFVHAGGAAPAFTITVSDGASNVGPAAANITFIGAGIGTPAPTPGGGGGGDTPVTPPTQPPVTPTVSTGMSPTTLVTFFRPGGSGEDADGDGVNFIEVRPVPAGLTVTDRAATPESLILPVRVQADAIDTTTLQREVEIAPIRAEMQVIPTRHELDLSEEERQRIDVVLNSVRITGLALSVGAVWWAARAAGLVASLLASSPAWRHVDPLPVLGRDEDEEEVWDESAEDQDKKDEEHRAAWVLEG